MRCPIESSVNVYSQDSYRSLGLQDLASYREGCVQVEFLWILCQVYQLVFVWREYGAVASGPSFAVVVYFFQRFAILFGELSVRQYINVVYETHARCVGTWSIANIE